MVDSLIRLLIVHYSLTIYGEASFLPSLCPYPMPLIFLSYRATKAAKAPTTPTTEAPMRTVSAAPDEVLAAAVPEAVLELVEEALELTASDDWQVWMQLV
jgi:hypothetical protein